MVWVITAVTAAVIAAMELAAARVRSYRGIHRRKGPAPQGRRRAAAGRAGRAGRGAWPASHAGSCACSTCRSPRVALALDPSLDPAAAGAVVYNGVAGTLCGLDAYGNGYRLPSALSQLARDNISRGLWQAIPHTWDHSEWDIGAEPSPAPAGVGLRYVPKPDFPVPVQLPDAGSNYAAAVAYMSFRLHTSTPPPAPAGTSPVVVSGSGYSSGGRPGGKSWRQAEMVRQLMENAAPAVIVGAVPATPAQPPPPARPPRYSSGGLIPSPPAPTAVAPPSWSAHGSPPRWNAGSSFVPARTPPARRTPAFTGRRGMTGFDGADFIAGSVTGYRWWTLQAPPLEKNPARAAQDWKPELLRGIRDIWQPGENIAVCKPYGGVCSPHLPSEVPHIDCSCGFWAYWQIQQHDVGGSNLLPVVGVVEGYGQLLTGPEGFRAGKAKIVALYLPLLIEPDLPVPRPVPPAAASAPSHLYPAGQYPDGRPRPWFEHPKFSGRVIGSRRPCDSAPREAVFAPAEPDPPTDEEIAEAKDRAEAWTAVISDRLELMYPGAEVFATLKLLLKKFPPVPQYTPPLASGYCGACSTFCEDLDAHHIVAHP